MMTKTAIVIQGPSTYVNELKEAWDGYDIIWSTWRGEENKYEPTDKVVFSQKPSNTGIQNLAMQHKTTIEGLKKAKELGYERVLKWRSDMKPTNPKKLFETFKMESLNFLAWHIIRGGYFVDYFVEGPIDMVYNAWDISEFNGDYSEQITTKNILGKLDNFNFIGNLINEDNEIIWVKKNVNLSIYKDIEEFKMDRNGK